ncbi:hypothetical protein ADJ73_07325 [Arsenicicoccus sp. oral taxon 190]|nr:hypothetical protein ADJ73_07325 [Arsenicicoccus sp. oral taxon 190]
MPAPVKALIARVARPSRIPVVAGRLTYVLAAVNVLAALFRSWRQQILHLPVVGPGMIASTAVAAMVVTGILLVPLGHALTRRKRRAWAVALAVLALTVVLHVVRLQLVAALPGVVLIVVLVRYRREFHAEGDPRTRWRALWAFLGLGLVSVVIGYLSLAVRADRMLAEPASPVSMLGYVLGGLVGMGEGLHFRHERTQDAMDLTLGSLGLMTLMVTAYLALRSPEQRPELTDEDDERLRALLGRHPDSLGYFNLRRDKSVVWSDSGKSAIAYRVVNGVMLASGDPIGDPEAWPGAIERFLELAERHAWTPAVLGCSERAGIVWTRDTDFEALELGDEAVVDTGSFSLEGRAMRNVRQMVRRIERAGYSTHVSRIGDLTPEQCETIRADAQAWRGTETERGFSMALGRLADHADPEAVLVTAVQEGRVRGFLQFVPWGKDGMSLDVMLRDKTAEGGLNELMIVAALTSAPSIGIRQVSLNFATFRAVLERGERLGAGPVTKVSRKVLVFLSRWFQIESLYRFNAKFGPRWQPRFLVFPASSSLPRIGIAALEAEAFLTWPRLTLLKGLTG